MVKSQSEKVYRRALRALQDYVRLTMDVPFDMGWLEITQHLENAEFELMSAHKKYQDVENLNININEEE